MIRVHAFQHNDRPAVVLEVETDEDGEDMADAFALDDLRDVVKDPDAWHQAEVWETPAQPPARNADGRTPEEQRALERHAVAVDDDCDRAVDSDPDGDFLRP